MSIILITLIFALALAFALGFALGFFKQIFDVKEDPLIVQIREVLPGANCGACGFPGCDGFAAAIAEKNADITGCPPGGKAVAEQLAALVGGSADIVPKTAVVLCRGTKDKSLERGRYIGVKNCRAVKISACSIKACIWACQGFGDCVEVCKFDAIFMGEDGLPQIDNEKCTGCGVCANECPQNIIKMINKDQKGAMVLCSNQNTIKGQVAKACKAGCIKCEICIKQCPEQCMKMENGIPVVDYSKCTGCRTCAEKCPKKVICNM